MGGGGEGRGEGVRFEEVTWKKTCTGASHCAGIGDVRLARYTIQLDRMPEGKREETTPTGEGERFKIH